MTRPVTWSLADEAMAGAHLSRVGSGRRVPLSERSTWYGEDPGFRRMVERDLERHVEHRGQVTSRLVAAYAPGMPRILQYRHAGVDVPSLRKPVPVLVEFHEFPSYGTFGLHSGDYPRVFADPGADSPHRMPDDDALCLYFPHDPPERRWNAAAGLVVLFNIAANHLFFELQWRATGGSGSPARGDGRSEGVWLGDEAPHDVPAPAGRRKGRRR